MTDGLTIDNGAIELPPDVLACEPIRVSNSPLAPTFAMPYIGLWGLVLVSLFDSAGITTPFVKAWVPGDVLSRIPRTCALSE